MKSGSVNFLILIGAFIAIVIGVFIYNNLQTSETIDMAAKITPGFDISKLKNGCSGKDCIPSIDNPNFISAKEAESRGEVNSEDVVFVIEHKGVVRAYPQRILNWHEIVNDKVAGDTILISFCPLCGTAIGFERTVKISDELKEVEFGVSGKLVNSNLVMYDRETDTLWQQLGGEAILGELVGQKLNPFPVDTVIWKDWKSLHPDTEVLSQETGHSRNYDSYPYGNYESDRRFLFSPEKTDDRLHPKKIVWGIKLNSVAKAYPEDKIPLGMTVDFVAEEKVTITKNKTGQVEFVDSKLVRIIPDRSMWFAWFAFNQDTLLYGE